VLTRGAAVQRPSGRPHLPASVVYRVSCEHFSQPLLEARDPIPYRILHALPYPVLPRCRPPGSQDPCLITWRPRRPPARAPARVRRSRAAPACERRPGCQWLARPCPCSDRGSLCCRARTAAAPQRCTTPSARPAACASGTTPYKPRGASARGSPPAALGKRAGSVAGPAARAPATQHVSPLCLRVGRAKLC